MKRVGWKYFETCVCCYRYTALYFLFLLIFFLTYFDSWFMEKYNTSFDKSFSVLSLSIIVLSSWLGCIKLSFSVLFFVSDISTGFSDTKFLSKFWTLFCWLDDVGSSIFFETFISMSKFNYIICLIKRKILYIFFYLRLVLPFFMIKYKHFKL